MNVMAFSKISISRKDFSCFSHRGFGEKTIPRYQKSKKLQSVANQLTGVELGIESGADTLEIDLQKTKDGKIVTTHGFLFSQLLQQTEKEFLHEYPEAFTFQELLDWVYHQDRKITLYLELKSPITIQEIFSHIDIYAKQVNKNYYDYNEIKDKLYQQIMLYTHNLQKIKTLIKEKQSLSLTTSQIRIWWVYLPLINNKIVNSVAQIGSKNSRIYGIEQGMMPWGTKPCTFLLDTPFAQLPPLVKVKNYFKNIAELVTCAQKLNLKFIVGTVNNPEWIRSLIKQGVNGVVPDNPHSFSLAGIMLSDRERKLQLYQTNGQNYIPLSMKQRLQID